MMAVVLPCGFLWSCSAFTLAWMLLVPKAVFSSSSSFLICSNVQVQSTGRPPHTTARGITTLMREMRCRRLPRVLNYSGRHARLLWWSSMLNCMTKGSANMRLAEATRTQCCKCAGVFLAAHHLAASWTVCMMAECITCITSSVACASGHETHSR